MLRTIPWIIFLIRLGYRIGHGIAYWCLRIFPMPTLWRHQLAGVVAIYPYLRVVWGLPILMEMTWRAFVVAGILTVGMLLLVRRTELRREANRYWGLRT